MHDVASSRYCACLIAILWLLAPFPSTMTASEGPTESVVSEINRRLNNQWQQAGITPAPAVEDRLFFRRVMLDLCGRIPSFTEQAEFIALDSPNKRAEVVDQFLESPDFSFHWRNQLEIWLLARLKNNSAFRDYLFEAVQENRSWDQIFRELIIPEVAKPDDQGAAAFLSERVRDLDSMTNDTSVLFFGVNISCAKCHDHPLVADWEQSHYFGMASFFKRTYRTKAGLLAERFDGEVKYTTVSGEDRKADFMFLNGSTTPAISAERTKEERKKLEQAIKKAQKDDKASPPMPDFSPRAALVDLALKAPNHSPHYFSRNLVNRVWAELLGKGFVNPLDQMHSESEVSHPELLDYLATEVIARQYDLRWIIRNIVLSSAYDRAASADLENESFAAYLPKALSPRQLALSLTVACQSPEKGPTLTKAAEWQKVRANLERGTDWAINEFEIPDDQFQVGSEEALFLSNNPAIEQRYLTESKSSLIGYLATEESVESQIRTAFQAVLCRTPAPEELEYLLKLHNDPKESRSLKQLIWALVSSAEFRFNY